MKTIAAALITGQLLTAAPACAADLHDSASIAGPIRHGSFVGSRFRILFGGIESGQARLSLTVAPLQRSTNSDGAAKLRFGEGVELSLAGRERPALRLGGHRFAPGGEIRTKDGKRLGVSTIGAAAIVGGVIVAGLVIYALAARGDP